MDASSMALRLRSLLVDRYWIAQRERLSWRLIGVAFSCAESRGASLSCSWVTSSR